MDKETKDFVDAILVGGILALMLVAGIKFFSEKLSGELVEDTKCKEFYGQEYSYIRGKEVCATKEGDIRFYELIE